MRRLAACAMAAATRAMASAATDAGDAEAVKTLLASARDDEALGRALAIGDVCAIGDGVVECDARDGGW